MCDILNKNEDESFNINDDNSIQSININLYS